MWELVGKLVSEMSAFRGVGGTITSQFLQLSNESTQCVRLLTLIMSRCRRPQRWKNNRLPGAFSLNDLFSLGTRDRARCSNDMDLDYEMRNTSPV